MFIKKTEQKLCFCYKFFYLLCFALLCFALLCFALLCFALLCFALLCFAQSAIKAQSKRNQSAIKAQSKRNRSATEAFVCKANNQKNFVFLKNRSFCLQSKQPKKLCFFKKPKRNRSFCLQSKQPKKLCFFKNNVMTFVTSLVSPCYWFVENNGSLDLILTITRLIDDLYPLLIPKPFFFRGGL